MISGSKCQAHYRHKTIIPVATKMLKLQRVEKDIGCGEEGVGPEWWWAVTLCTLTATLISLPSPCYDWHYDRQARTLLRTIPRSERLLRTGSVGAGVRGEDSYKYTQMQCWAAQACTSPQVRATKLIDYILYLRAIGQPCPNVNNQHFSWH